MSIKLTLIVFLFFCLIIGSTLAGSIQTRSIEIKNDNVEIRDHTLTGTSDFLPNNKAIKKTSTEVVSSSILSQANLDLDGDQTYDALTDGLLILRSMFGLTGEALISGAISDSAVYSTSTEIELRFKDVKNLLDVDNNGSIDALTDGLIILRYLFGLRGQSLISSVISADAQRTDPYDVLSYVGQLASLNIEACMNAPSRFYKMPSSGQNVSFGLEGEDKDFFEVSIDGYLSFKDTVPSSSADGDQVFEIGVKQEASNISNDIRWLAVTLIEGYAIEVTHLFPGKNALLRPSNNKLVVKGILSSSSKNLLKSDIETLIINSSTIDDLEEINGDIFWSKELDEKSGEIELEVTSTCGNNASNYQYSQENETDSINPLRGGYYNPFVLDEENDRIIAHKAYENSSSLISFNLKTSLLTDITAQENCAYPSLMTFNPTSEEILSVRFYAGIHTINQRTNLETGDCFSMFEMGPYTTHEAIWPVRSYGSQAAWMLHGSGWDDQNEFHDGILTVVVGQNGYFRVLSSIDDRTYSDSRMLVDQINRSVIFPDQLPSWIAPYLYYSGDIIQYIDGKRFFAFDTSSSEAPKIWLYNIDNNQARVIVDFTQNPPPDIEILTTHSKWGWRISNDGNSVYFNTAKKFMIYDVTSQTYEVVFGQSGDHNNALNGMFHSSSTYPSAVVFANNNKTLAKNYGVFCEPDSAFGTIRLGAIKLSSGEFIYDKGMGCNSDWPIDGYNLKNKILLTNRGSLKSLNLDDEELTVLKIFSDSEYVAAAHMDEKDTTLYFATDQRLYIFDMITKSVISSRSFEGTQINSVSSLQKNTSSSAIYVASGYTGESVVYAFNAESLESEPIKILDNFTFDNSVDLPTMQYSSEFNSLYFGVSLIDQSNRRSWGIGVFNLDSLTTMTHQIREYSDNAKMQEKAASPLTNMLIDNNSNLLYFQQLGEFNVYNIEADQSSIIIN